MNRYTDEEFQFLIGGHWTIIMISNYGTIHKRVTHIKGNEIWGVNDSAKGESFVRMINIHSIPELDEVKHSKLFKVIIE